VTGRAEGVHLNGWIPPRIRRDAGECEEHSVSTDKRTRWETSWRLGRLFGVAPRFGWRDPEAPRFGCAPAPSGVGRRAGSRSARGEGESPTVELVGLGGEEGQESIGFSGCLTIPGRERLLSRSKALKSGSSPAGVVLHWSETEPVVASLGVPC